MARKLKVGLDYFELDCHMNEKIELIEAEYGLKGFAIIVKLYQGIYGGFGYYCEWTPDISLLWARRLGVSQGGAIKNLDKAKQSASLSGFPNNLINNVVSAAIRRDIFSAKLFQKYQILTSIGIQERYLNAVSRREKIELKKEYLLIDVPKNRANVAIYSISGEKNSNSEERNEQSRVEKSNKEICAPKPHERDDWEESHTNKEAQLAQDFQIIYGIYPKKKGKTVAFVNYKQWVSPKGKDVGGKRYRLTNRQIYLAVKKYVRQQEEAGNDDLQYWKNFDTLMGRQLLDYVEWEGLVE